MGIKNIYRKIMPKFVRKSISSSLKVTMRGAGGSKTGMLKIKLKTGRGPRMKKPRGL